MQPAFFKWCEEQGKRIADEMRRDAMAGVFKSLRFIPATETEFGKLALAHGDEIPGSIELRPWGQSIGSIPYSALVGAIAETCGSLPVYPGINPTRIEIKKLAKKYRALIYDSGTLVTSLEAEDLARLQRMVDKDVDGMRMVPVFWHPIIAALEAA